MDQYRVKGEVYEKEQYKSLKWFYDNIDYIQNAAIYEHESKAHVQEIVEKFKSEYEKSQQKPKTDRRIEAEIKLSKVCSKIEISEDIKKILRESEDGRGTSNYLRELQSKSPEKRFCYPETTNMIYGWNIANIDRTPVESRGKIDPYKSRLDRSSGMQYNPEHYKEPTNFN